MDIFTIITKIIFSRFDANYTFIYVDIGSFGKDSDSAIFEMSSFYKKLKNNELNISRKQPLPGTFMPFTFIGDEAFSLSEHMRPFSGKVLSDKQRIFNYRLSRARRNIESSFGILSNKWKIFQKSINVDLDLAISLIKTCCGLHNFVRSKDGFTIQDALSVEGFIDIDQNARPSRAPMQFIQVRNHLADYFTSGVGSVPWQRNNI